MNRKTGTAIGILIAFCLIYAALITSVEAVCYWTPGYFETEYEKYHVLDSLPEMSMSEEDGLMAVTHHMMKYLRGDQDAPELQIEVKMGGERRGFFTEREILHMEDVRNLFIGAQRLRAAALILAAVLGACLFWQGKVRDGKQGTRWKQGAEPLNEPGTGTAQIAKLRQQMEKMTMKESWQQSYFGICLAKGLLIGTGLFLVLCVLLGVIVASDFTNAFITFHHIFFTNDLWILDPSVDMLVNIVPEGFFFDTASRILLLFGAALLILCAGAGLYLRRAGANRKRR